MSTNEVFGRARNHGKKFLKLSRTSFGGHVHRYKARCVIYVQLITPLLEWPDHIFFFKYVVSFTTVVTAGNLILGKLGTRVHKNHCVSHASKNKSTISKLFRIFEEIFSKMLIISGKWQVGEELRRNPIKSIQNERFWCPIFRVKTLRSVDKFGCISTFLPSLYSVKFWQSIFGQIFCVVVRLLRSIWL